MAENIMRALDYSITRHEDPTKLVDALLEVLVGEDPQYQRNALAEFCGKSLPAECLKKLRDAFRAVK